MSRITHGHPARYKTYHTGRGNKSKRVIRVIRIKVIRVHARKRKR